MSTADPAPVAEPLPARHGWLAAAVAVIMVILGIVVVARPGAALIVVAVLFGLQLIATGVGRIIGAALGRFAPRWWRILAVVLGALTVIAGVICLILPGTSLLVIAILIAAAWLADGIIQLASGAAVYRTGWQRVGQIVFGVLSIVAAIVVIVWPAQSLVLMTQVGGTILIVLGVVALVAAVLTIRGTRAGGVAA
jgi:uncharacterized membrane protein HdeD (DUF308 family)